MRVQKLADEVAGEVTTSVKDQVCVCVCVCDSGSWRPGPVLVLLMLEVLIIVAGKVTTSEKEQVYVCVCVCVCVCVWRDQALADMMKHGDSNDDLEADMGVPAEIRGVWFSLVFSG